MTLDSLDIAPLAALVPLLPVIGALTLGLWGRWTPEVSGRPVAILAAALAWLTGITVFGWQVAANQPVVLPGPTWLVIPGSAAASVDLSIHVDDLGLLWLVLTGGTALLSIVLDRSRPVVQERRLLIRKLLALAAVQALFLTGDAVVLFVLWEVSLFATWHGLRLREDGARDTAGDSMLLTNLVGSLPLLAALSILWQSFGIFRLSVLLDPRVLSALPDEQSAAVTLLAYCMIGAVFVRCAQFPLCTWLLRTADAAATDVGWIVGVAILPPAGYLLVRCAGWLTIGPGPPALLVGAGCLSALLWGAIGLTQPNLIRSALAFAAGTFGLVAVGIGSGDAVHPLMLAASVCAGVWGLLWLAERRLDSAGDAESTRPQSSEPSFANRSGVVPGGFTGALAGRAGQARRLNDLQRVVLLLVAAALSCGAWGQEAVLDAAWNRSFGTASSSFAPLADEVASGASSNPVGNRAMPALVLAAQALLVFTLFRGVFRFTRPAEPIEADSADRPARRTVAAVLVCGGALAAGPLLTWLGPLDRAVSPFHAPVVTGLLALVALLGAYVVCSGPKERTARLEGSFGALARLSRRCFYVDEMLQVVWNGPVSAVAWMTAYSDSTFGAAWAERGRRARARLVLGWHAVRREGHPLPYLLTLLLAASAMILLLAGN